MTILLSVLFGLLSMLAYGFANAFTKPLSQKLGAGQVILLRGFTITLILAVASIPSYSHLQHWQAALATIVLGVVGYMPVLAFTHAIKSSPLGIIAPIAGTSPLFTIIFSFLFLDLLLNPRQWFAIMIVIAANVIVSVDLKNWKQSRFLRISSGIPYALVASVGWGLFYFLLIPATRTLGPLLAAFLVELGVTLAAAMHVKTSRRPVRFKDSLRLTVLGNALLICLGTVAFTVGVKYYNIGIVAVLSNSTALVTSLIGIYFFHERLHIKDRLAAFIMIAGIALLSV